MALLGTATSGRTEQRQPTFFPRQWQTAPLINSIGQAQKFLAAWMPRNFGRSNKSDRRANGARI